MWRPQSAPPDPMAGTRQRAPAAGTGSPATGRSSCTTRGHARDGGADRSVPCEPHHTPAPAGGMYPAPAYTPGPRLTGRCGNRPLPDQEPRTGRYGTTGTPYLITPHVSLLDPAVCSWRNHASAIFGSLEIEYGALPEATSPHLPTRNAAKYFAAQYQHRIAGAPRLSPQSQRCGGANSATPDPLEANLRRNGELSVVTPRFSRTRAPRRAGSNRYASHISNCVRSRLRNSFDSGRVLVNRQGTLPVHQRTYRLAAHVSLSHR